jgi:hypothetical protein
MYITTLAQKIVARNLGVQGPQAPKRIKEGTGKSSALVALLDMKCIFHLTKVFLFLYDTFVCLVLSTR